MAKKQFKAESKRMLDLMINSIYTHKEIFLRELVSNASDAIDKLCYKSLTDQGVGMSRADFRIRITPDEAARTLTISDNGIGMTKEELEANLGVIAHSGSLQFKAEMDAAEKEKEDLDIIGQFGVGFYAAFMVADKVTVLSRAYGAEEANRWVSDGADGYTITPAEKDSVGTDIILHLKPDTDDEKYGDYLHTWQLRSLIKKYSDYIRWPIRMEVESGEYRDTGETDEDGEPKQEYVTFKEEQTINSMVPLWQRSRGDASDEDCIAFYKEKFHDSQDPACIIRVNAEGLVSYKALLFVPITLPYDYYTREFKSGLQLYSNNVMIMEHCADLLPECFRFVRGVVDTPDVSLNISRELLQHDRQLKAICNNLEKKIKTELKKLMDTDRDKYNEFFAHYGAQLKYGTVAGYGEKKELLTDLLTFACTGAEKPVSLAEYKAGMPEAQKFIYYAAAANVAQAAKLPQAEQVKAAGYELLCTTGETDEFVIHALGSYEEKPFCNIISDDLGLETEEEAAETEEKAKAAKELLDFVKETLGEAVSDVRLSHKLKTHPVCLTTEGEITLEMERYFASIPDSGMGEVKAQRVLELNAAHPAYAALESAFAEDKDKAARLARILHAQAQLIAGEPIADPSDYAELVCSLF